MSWLNVVDNECHDLTFTLMIRVAVCAIIVAVASAGEHTPPAFLGSFSALAPGARSLPFTSVTHSLSNAVVLTSSTPHIVTWSGITEPTEHDLIALTCADEQTWPLHQALDAVRATGSAEGEVWLPELPANFCRSGYSVLYIRASPTLDGSGEIVAEVPLVSTPPSRADSSRVGSFPLIHPKQIHLGYTAKHDELLVMWRTQNSDEAKDYKPVVKWGLAEDALTHIVNTSAMTTTYAASDLCNAPANETGPLKFIDPGHMHRIILNSLPLDRVKIYYVVGSDAHGYSPVTSFTTRSDPMNATSSAECAFIMYADQALPIDIFGSDWHLPSQVIEDLDNGFDGFLLHPGDLGYAMGFGWVWDIWMELIEPIASRVAYMVTIGNHEYDTPTSWEPQHLNNGTWGDFGDDSHGECGVPTCARFNGTGTANAGAIANAAGTDGSNGVYWYSFEEGPVHIVMLSSEHDWTNGSTQQAWLERDLASVDKAKTPWIVVATHRMMYTTQLKEEGDYKVSLAFRAHNEHLLRKYKVDLMMVGHQHSYERSCEVWNGTCVDLDAGERGTVHVVVGSAGASLEKGNFSNTLGNFSLKHINAWGYTRVKANRTAMHVEWIKVGHPLIGVKAKVVWDSFTLKLWV